MILGLYEVTAELGKGGMGMVHRVRHRAWNMDLAVKSPHAWIIAQPGGQEAFIQEAETWVNLGMHPHTVSCFYVRTLGRIPRVFAEFVEGGSLAEWIKTRKLYEGGVAKALVRIVDVAIQFAWGLSYAHGHGLVHQDVKPANVMMTSDGIAKVTDFGLARAGSEQPRENRGADRPGGPDRVPDLGLGRQEVTCAGGTEAYFSPEQAEAQAQGRDRTPQRQRTRLDFRTDMWSWGVSVLEMFLGERTWQHGQAAGAVLEGVLDAGIVEESMPRMPIAMSGLLQRVFRRNRAERPESMEAMVDQLRVIYRECAGIEYPRPAPKEADLLADGMNNRAVSLLDLGRTDEASRSLDQAIASDPRHLESTYNRGLLRWRTGQCSDLDLVGALAEFADHGDRSQDAATLLEAVHRERRALGETGPHCVRRRNLQEGALECVALTPDAQRALVALKNRRVAFVDLRTMETLRTVQGAEDDHQEGPHRWEVSPRTTHLALTPDARFGILAKENRRVEVWDLTDGRCGCALALPSAPTAVALTPDGRLCLVAARDGSLSLWDLRLAKCLGRWRHPSVAWTVRITSDGRRGASVSEDASVRAWDFASGQKVPFYVADRVNSAEPAEVVRILDSCFRWGAAWSKVPIEGNGDARRASLVAVPETSTGAIGLISEGSTDGSLQLLDLSSRRCLRTLEGQPYHVGQDKERLAREVKALLESPEAATELGKKKLQELLSPTYGHLGWVKGLAMTPDGHQAVSVGHDGTLRLWTLDWPPAVEAAYALVRPRVTARLASESSMAEEATRDAEDCMRRGDFLSASAAMIRLRKIPGHERRPEVVSLWRRVGAKGRRIASRGGWLERAVGKCFHPVALSPDGCRILVGGAGNDLLVVDPAGGEPIQTLAGHSSSVYSVSLCLHGSGALSGSADHTLRLWDLRNGACLGVLEGHREDVYCTSMTPDGRRGLSGSRDTTIRTWDLSKGRCLGVLEGHRSAVTSVAIRADGRVGVSSSGDNTVRIWDLETGKCVRLDVDSREPYAVEFLCMTPDARCALTGSYTGTVRAWDLSTGRCIRECKGHSGPVRGVALTADGRWGLSGSWDETLRLWDLASGACVWTSPAGGGVHDAALAMTPDGTRVIAPIGGKLRLWELDWDYEVPISSEWDERARPWLDLAGSCPARDIEQLLQWLRWADLGWIRSDRVRAEFETMGSHPSFPMATD